jgi:chromosome segregation ATPase
VAEVGNVVGQLTGQLEDLRTENGQDRFAVGEVARANERLRAEAAELKQRMEMLEQENRRLSAVNEAVKRGVVKASDCCPKVKRDLKDLEHELTKLREEMRATKPKPESLAPPAADVAVLPAAKATAAPELLSSPPPPNLVFPLPKPAAVKVLPPAPPKRAK